MSSAAIRSALTPNSASRSSAPPRPASRITSSGSSIRWNPPEPSSPLTTRVTFMSTMARRCRDGTTSIRLSPRSRRATLPSSNTRGVPGRPSAAPVMTTGEPTGAARVTSEISATSAAGRAAPNPAAYSPHSPWLNAVASASLGWLVDSADTPGRWPSVSSARLASARLGPTSTKVRTPSAYSVSRPLTNWTGEATWRASRSTIASRDPSPAGYSAPVTLATTGRRGGRTSSRSSTERSGALAGATIWVWNAWLTGSRTHE